MRAPAAKRAPHYRRRRPLPALVLLFVLGSVAVFVWSKVFGTTADPEAGIRCNPPTGSPGSSLPAPPSIGRPLPRNALDRTDPLPAAAVKARVLNASTSKGQAALVAQVLHDLGFGQAAEPDNDTAYPAQDMTCHGQIRFGSHGAGAARTLSVAVPCAELVTDDRLDDTVDLALGKSFNELKPNQHARKALEQLRDWAEQHAAHQGGQQAEPSAARVDHALLAAARDVRC
jgi:hypothetical protein